MAGFLAAGPYSFSTRPTTCNPTSDRTRSRIRSTAGHARHAQLTGVSARPAKHLQHAVQPFAGARGRPRHRRPRQLHRLQGHQIPYRRNINQPLPSTVGLRSRAGRIRSTATSTSPTTAPTGSTARCRQSSEALQPRPAVQLGVDVGKGDQRGRRYRRFRAQHSHRERIRPPPRSRATSIPCRATNG